MATPTKNNPHGLKVGQAIFARYKTYSSREMQSGIFTIEKIGREYARLHTGVVINMESLRPKSSGYVQDFKAYLSEDHYNAVDKLNEEWHKLYASLHFSPPKNMTHEKLQAIKQIINSCKGPS